MAGGNDTKNQGTWRPITAQASSSSAVNHTASTSVTKPVITTNPKFSHFISLPLSNHPEPDKLFMLQNSFSHLTNSGIEESIFIKRKTFHLTVLMLKLWNKERVDEAARVLQSISSQVRDALKNRPISIRLQGLACMQGSEAKARVVYAPVVEVGGEGRLLEACHVIIEAFINAGLVVDTDVNRSLSLKLHATVMNASYRKRVEGRPPMHYFDARPVLSKHGSEDWGEYVIGEAHLSQRFVFDANGYYHCCASLPFP